MSQKEKIVTASEEDVAKYAGGGDAGTESATASEQAAPATPDNDWKDIALRARAELSNYQKRAEKDRSESMRYANAGLIRALLSVLDNLERVVQTGEDSTANPQAIADGARLTLDSFHKVLRDFSVQPITAEGEPFDPQIHEAMMERPSDHAERTVLQELAKGYRLHDRVLRPAKVIVSKPAE